MPYVPGFQHDVFISYARGEPDALASDDARWMRRFRWLLERNLVNLLGRKHKPDVWMDTDLRSGDDFEEQIFTRLGTSVVFVAVVSSDYVNSDYCRRELDEFAKYKRPIIQVIKTPLGPFDEKPRPDLHYVDFFEGPRGDERVFTPRDWRFEVLLGKVSSHIRGHLIDLLRSKQKVYLTHIDPKSADAVLFTSHRRRIEAEFRQRGYMVLPTGPYRENRNDDRWMVERCDALVHFVDGTNQVELKAARELGIPTVICSLRPQQDVEVGDDVPIILSGQTSSKEVFDRVEAKLSAKPQVMAA